MPRKASTPEPAVSEVEAVLDAATEQVPDTADTVTRASFEPSKYLMKLKGKDYLEVKWRLVWLRDAQPDAVVETELVKSNEKEAIFRAKVTLPTGASATGWGSEEKSDFGDFLEKAETKALGRALGALGFGTQFSEDFEFGAEQGRVVDSPVGRPNGRSNGTSNTGSSGIPNFRRPNPDNFPTQNVPNGWACEECGEQLRDSTSKDGNDFPAGQKAYLSVRDVGRVLCFNHLRAAKEAAAV